MIKKFNKDKKNITIDNLARLMNVNNVIIVHHDQNILAKIEKCLEKTK